MPACRGVWLDKGGLDKIIERSAEWEKPFTPPSKNTTNGGKQHSDHHLDSYYNKHKKERLPE